MAHYKYSCVFTKDKSGCWEAEFPDWVETMGGRTCGKNWQHILYMAQDLLNLMCLTAEEDHIPFPEPSHCPIEEGNIVRMVEADTVEYAKAVALYAKVGRFRMAERARERYLYHKGPQQPEETA